MTDPRTQRLDEALARVAEETPIARRLQDLPLGQRAQAQRAAVRAGLSVEAYLARAALETAPSVSLSNDGPVGLAAEVRRWR